MAAEQEKRDKSPSRLSMKSDNSSMVQPLNFSSQTDTHEYRGLPCSETEKQDANDSIETHSLGYLSMSDHSIGLPPDHNPGHGSDANWKTRLDATHDLGKTQATTRENNLDVFPRVMEDWNKDQVKEWLIISLRFPQDIAQKLYDQEMTGACLVSYVKQDLIDLGVPSALAVQVIRQVERFRRKSDSVKGIVRIPKSRISRDLNESMEAETASLNTEIQSQSLSLQLLQEAKEKIQSLHIGQTADDKRLRGRSLYPGTTICLPRPFDKNDPSFIYRENEILPPVASITNLLDPVHEYHLLPTAKETSEREIIYEFTKETACFAASCLNSRTNGTIHFGVKSQPGEGYGQVIGNEITSISKYSQAFDMCLTEYFEEEHVRACIRPPQFFQVQSPDGTTSKRWVVEVDVVPTYLVTQEKLFYTSLKIASEEKEQLCKTECLFVRDGSRSINILADPNPRVSHEKMKGMTGKVKCWAIARKSAEERDNNKPSQGHHGQRLKQLITCGRDTLDYSIQVIVVTSKCHSSQLEHLGFLKEMKLFAVLEFDPESDINGTCSFYRRDHIANLHYPWMYTTQDRSLVIKQLNLFQQTSWVFCNGRENETNESNKPLETSEWLKKRSGDMATMVSFLCNPDLLSKDGLLIVFILHSAVNDISSPIMETFCAIYRTMEGNDNVVCICKDSNVFKEWRQLIETRCKVDITSKCIYELSLNEINCTINKLKEPQTKSSSRYIPSSGLSSVLLTTKDEELMTVLDILSENECENTEIEKKESFEEFKMKTEEYFYRGGQVTWWNFNFSEKRGSLPFIKRDKYSELNNLITPVEGYTSPCVIINLFHHPGCGGTTLAMHVLWNLRDKFRCAVVKNNSALNKEVAVQVKTLLTHGNQEQSCSAPVLLLVDNCDDVEDLKQCILSVASERNRQSKLMVVILNCERTQFPEDNSRNSRIANVYITNKLSPKEQNLFSEKLKHLKDYHKKPETFYAFMIMTNNFSEDYIENLVNNILKDLDVTTKQALLLSFLSLLNTYVNGSHMSLALCEELLGIRNALWGRETLEKKINPYSTLLIKFTVEEHGTYQAVRFLHQMIASKCLQVLNQKHKLSCGEITINMLHRDHLYKSCMGKDTLVQHIQTSMLIKRHRKEQGDDKDTLFSPLIEEIYSKEGREKVKEILEYATIRFDRSATLPQALARHFYLNEENFHSALHWALDARQKNCYSSYIADTLGQVYKSELKKETNNLKNLTPEGLDKSLKLAFNAIDAFRESQELAKNEEESVELHNKKKQRSYNTSGYVGEIEVTLNLFEVIEAIPLFTNRDGYKQDKMLQFLQGQITVNSFHEIHDTTEIHFISVLQEHERKLVSLKPRLKEIFSLFENYFTYMKPRSLEKETVEDRNKRKISECFKRYVQIFCKSKEEKALEKASKPKLSQRQEMEDQRHNLELKRADSFAGLLQYIDRNAVEMEHILKKWQYIIDNSPKKNVSDIFNFILANIVLHSIKPSSKVPKRYEELVDLLNEMLQIEGTHSSHTELYYISMLLLWPTKNSALDNSTMFRNISMYVTSVKKSFQRRFSHMLPGRSTIAHFFLGKSDKLKRIISKSKLDQVISASKQHASLSQPRNLHPLWQSGAVWKEPEVQKMLLRVKGKSENGDIYVYYGANQKILVRPVYLGGIRSGYSHEEVSFYLGFTMEGPVAYDIKYEHDP